MIKNGGDCNDKKMDLLYAFIIEGKHYDYNIINLLIENGCNVTYEIEISNLYKQYLLEHKVKKLEKKVEKLTNMLQNNNNNQQNDQQNNQQQNNNILYPQLNDDQNNSNICRFIPDPF
jgi:hypothetical protein